MNEILNTILKDTFSLAQLKHRIRILKSNLLRTFFDNQPSHIYEGVLSHQDLNWLKSLPSDFYQQFNKNNVYQIFSSLDDNSANLPILIMYLTFEPDEATLNLLGLFTRKQFNNPSLMLDIKFDPNLIAGIALVWKGVLRDYSLRLRIESKKSEILEGFKRFLR